MIPEPAEEVGAMTAFKVKPSSHQNTEQGGFLVWSRKTWMGCAGAALASLAPLVGCRSDGEHGSGGGGCCRGTSPGDSRVSASAPVGATSRLGDGADGRPAASPPAEALYGGQRTCPVTGAALGSMGSPVPVTLNGQTAYVCCRACVAKAQRDPDAFLRKVQADRSLAGG